MRNKYHRCLEIGHGWSLYHTRHPTVKESPDGSGNIIACLSIGMQESKENAVGERNKKNGVIRM